MASRIMLKAPVPMDEETLQSLVDAEAEFEFALESADLDFEVGVSPAVERTIIQNYADRMRDIIGG